MASYTASKDLFGGSKPWHAAGWQATDDRVRGGKSKSFLTVLPDNMAVFSGTLDIKTLGGAGFASQRTTGEDRTWDLSKYDGILLKIAEADSKMYALTLKDEVLPKRGDGREQSGVSWEYEFRKEEGTEESEGMELFVPWNAFKATYRGREKKDAKPLDLKSIKRISFMMRSFFGEQEGKFSLTIASLSAVSKPADGGAESEDDSMLKAKSAETPKEKRGLLSRLLNMCGA